MAGAPAGAPVHTMEATSVRGFSVDPVTSSILSPSRSWLKTARKLATPETAGTPPSGGASRSRSASPGTCTRKLTSWGGGGLASLPQPASTTSEIQAKNGARIVGLPGGYPQDSSLRRQRIASFRGSTPAELILGD